MSCQIVQGTLLNTLQWPIWENNLQKRKVKVTQSFPTLRDPIDCSPWNSPGQNTGVGSCSLLQGIFPTQGSSPSLPHCRQILHQLSHQESPRILEWVAVPFSRGSSWPRNCTRVSCIAGGFFTSWATGEGPKKRGYMYMYKRFQGPTIQYREWYSIFCNNL